MLAAAFDLFREHGFSSTSMLDIVTRARVSKRDLYALFKNKHTVLAACIGERTQQMRLPLDPAVPMPQTRSALAALLVELGVSILKTVCHPEVLTVFRLAIAESDRAPWTNDPYQQARNCGPTRKLSRQAAMTGKRVRARRAYACSLTATVAAISMSRGWGRWGISCSR